MTPAELWVEFDAGREVRRKQFERDTTLAWQANRIYVQTQNQKRLPKLSSLIPKRHGSPSMGRPSLESQKATLFQLAQQYGGAVRQVA